jgi:hypothetical protein
MRLSKIPAATALTVALMSLCACTIHFGQSDADRAGDATAAAPQAIEFSPVSAVTVTFSDQVQQLAASDPRLSPDEVAIAIEHELQVRQLYAPAAPNVHRSLVITVQNFNNSLASNTKILGYTYRNVMLNGTVEVQPAGPGQTPFDVRARVRLSSRGTDADGGSLASLYTRFAVETVAALRGVEPPAQ